MANRQVDFSSCVKYYNSFIYKQVFQKTQCIFSCCVYVWLTNMIRTSKRFLLNNLFKKLRFFPKCLFFCRSFLLDLYLNCCKIAVPIDICVGQNLRGGGWMCLLMYSKVETFSQSQVNAKIGTYNLVDKSFSFYNKSTLCFPQNFSVKNLLHLKVIFLKTEICAEW